MKFEKKQETSITLDEFRNYYENKFQEDFKQYYRIYRQKDGERTVSGVYPVKDDAALGYPAKRLESRKRFWDLPFSEVKEDFMFAGVVAFLVKTQMAIRTVADDLFHLFMKDWQYPLFTSVVNEDEGYYGLAKDVVGKVLESSRIYPYSRNERALFVNVLKTAWPYLMEHLFVDVCSWNDRYFERNDRNGDSMRNSMERILRDDLTELCQQYSEDASGMGVEAMNTNKVERYYREKFRNDLYAYFKIVGDDNSAPVIGFHNMKKSMCLRDLRPGVNEAEDFIFSGIVLYMMIAQQAVKHVCPTAERSFCDSALWPSFWDRIGDFPLPVESMIKKAELFPQPEESMTYLEMMNVVMPRMNEKINGIFNGTDANIVNRDAFNHLHELVPGQLRKRILEEIDQRLKDFKALVIAQAYRYLAEMER